jgi:hypothetical protein
MNEDVAATSVSASGRSACMGIGYKNTNEMKLEEETDK